MVKKGNIKTRKVEQSEVQDWQESYYDGTTRNFDFSDFVRVRSYPRGMLLAFAQMHPAEEKKIVFKEILIPFDVAISLHDVVGKQLEELVKDGRIKIEGEGK